MSLMVRMTPEQAKARAAHALLSAMSLAGTKGMFFCARCGGISFHDFALSCPHPYTARYSLEQMSVADLFSFWQMVQSIIDLGAMTFEL